MAGLGSDYWVQNPTWKIKQVAADLNFDGMGTEVYGPVKVVVGYGAEHSTLGAVLSEVAAGERSESDSRSDARRALLLSFGSLLLCQKGNTRPDVAGRAGR